MILNNKKNVTYKVSCYEVFKNNKLGKGNYSEVFLGKCLDLGKITKFKIINGFVAIKKINVANLNKNSLKKIKDEVKVMELIRDNPHENIVGCYDIIDDIDTIYIVMEYCVDGDLSRYLGCPISEHKCQNYFHQITKGLIYLYDNNIIHRDLKPKNILLTDNKRNIKLCDFGLSKITTNLTRVNTVCGSPLYMAPEILNHKEYDNKIDMWSIGIILYEMLFGYHPLIHCKDIDDLKNYLNEKNIDVPPKDFKGIISVDCENLLKLLLEKVDRNRIDVKKILDHKWINKKIFTHTENIGNEQCDIFNFEY